MDSQEDRLYSILRQNEDNLLSPNDSMLAATVIIKNKMEQYLKKIYQKNKTSKVLLKKKLGFIILEIKGQLYISQLL